MTAGGNDDSWSQMMTTGDNNDSWSQMMTAGDSDIQPPSPTALPTVPRVVAREGKRLAIPVHSDNLHL